ncbi:MAG: hypothetical protein ABSD28_14940 [Tepidisphaeraceae bacterium]
MSHSGDRLVDAKAILEALSELKRRGNKTVMAELESIEPELAGYAMEELGLIYQALSRTGARTGELRRLYRQIESLVLVAILALRHAQRRLWEDEDSPPSIPPRDSPA